MSRACHEVWVEGEADTTRHYYSPEDVTARVALSRFAEGLKQDGRLTDKPLRIRLRSAFGNEYVYAAKLISEPTLSIERANELATEEAHQQQPSSARREQAAAPAAPSLPWSMVAPPQEGSPVETTVTVSFRGGEPRIDIYSGGRRVLALAFEDPAMARKLGAALTAAADKAEEGR